MGPILALVIIIVLSLLIVRLATNALILTGMSLDVAKFQSASAFFGVGFTTSEAEMVVDHPVRRKIISHLIIVGNIGITSALATIIITFLRDTNDPDANLFLLISAAVLFLVFLAVILQFPFVKRPIDHLMKMALNKAGLHAAVDYELLLNLRDGYQVSDFVIPEDHKFANKSLKESRPVDEGIVILGIERSDGEYEGAPGKDAVIKPGDTVMVYGNEESVEAMVKES